MLWLFRFSAYFQFYLYNKYDIIQFVFTFGVHMEEIKVKYFVDGIDELCYVAGKSDWIDLHAAVDVDMKAGEFRLIPLAWPSNCRRDTRLMWFPAAPPSRTTVCCKPTPWAWWTTPTGGTTTSGTSPCMQRGTSTSTRTPASASSAL